MAISQIYDMSARQVWVGRYDEHGSREVAWDVSPWTSKLGSDGVFALLVTRPRDTDSPYNAQVSFDASTNLVTWAVTDVDTALKGWGRAELHYYVDGALVKSQTFVTIIEKAMFAGSTAPSAAESWVERMEQAALDAQAAAETAEDAETTATSAATTATSAAATAITAANSASSSASSARADATTATNAATAAALSESAASTSATNAAASAEAASTSALTASTAASTATTKASQASASASTAATAATTATNKASEATTAAQTATTKAGEASTSASTATSAKDTAVSASQTATTKATEATTAAATATSAATTATTAKDDAVSAKTAAQTAQTGAETAAASVQSSAEQIATNAADISQLKSEITDKSDTADMLKAFPTDTASGSVASFADGANVPVKSLIVNIDPVQNGSGDPSPTNVRPISGWSEVNVQRTGKNLLPSDFSAYSSVRAYKMILSIMQTGMIANMSFTDKDTSINASGCYIGFCNSDYDPTTQQSPSQFRWCLNNGVVQNVKTNISINDGATICGGIFIYPNDEETFNKIFARYNVQVEYGEVPTPYEPYSGTSITIPLGQTVYGGKLDVVSGELVIDRAMVDLGTLAWINNGANSAYTTALTNKLSGGDNCICSALVKVAQWTAVNSMPNASFKTYADSVDVAVKLSGITGGSAATMLSGFMFCYPLATPLTVQLTPHEVTALLGSNNVWADSGDSTVEYRADPTLYIGRLTEPDADMVADANITSGQYFMVGNTLYKATANIASGATISPNVNCTRKSLSEALNEINA